MQMATWQFSVILTLKRILNGHVTVLNVKNIIWIVTWLVYTLDSVLMPNRNPEGYVTNSEILFKGSRDRFSVLTENPKGHATLLRLTMEFITSHDSFKCHL